MSRIRSSLREDARPAILFFVNDWLSDPGLRACSLAAQGLWMNCLCIMHTACDRGMLTVNGKKVDPIMLANIVGRSEAEVTAALGELEKNGVYSILPDGTIFCRRMRRESVLRQKRSEAGQKGNEIRWQSRRKNEDHKYRKDVATLEDEDDTESEENLQQLVGELASEDFAVTAPAEMNPIDKAIAELKAENARLEAELEAKREREESCQ
jgi:uncharacterized small protein (DUF1192 family)